jgi:hypothetical protein
MRAFLVVHSVPQYSLKELPFLSSILLGYTSEEEAAHA